MQNKTALIVDDSRTATQMLRLMLEREDFTVDVLGSAEDALGYLRDHRPGVIFMDHLMPGMDGFQAVKEIKSSSATSTIPIVMYTAKSGDLYVGQAHALGAVDILPKPPTRETLRAVFRRIDERAEAESQAAAEPLATPAPVVEGAIAVSISEPVSVELQDADADVDDLAFRAPDKAPQPPAAVEFTEVVGESREELPFWRRIPLWFSAAAAAASFVVGMQFAGVREPENPYLSVVSWAVSEGMSYPFGESPFSGERMETLRGLIEHLAGAGFEGTVKLEGHVGQFCLVAANGGWKVPDANLPIESCDTIGLNAQEARQFSARQAPEFRDFLQNSPLLARSGIRVEIEPRGDRLPQSEYPAQDRVATAGDWNRIAALNNRVSVTLIPAP
jgi:DNA-binding response OmpR family regulator